MKITAAIILLILINLSICSQWAVQSSGTSTNLNGIYFTDANTGTAVGLSGVIRRTTNGGINWFSQNIAPDHLYGVYFINSNTGFICGNAIITKTTNGGDNWVQQTWAPAALQRGIYFLDANTGFSVGSSGTIIKTTNSGANWTIIPSGTTEFLSTIIFANTNTGYITGYNGIILKTTNGGDNWQMLSTGVSDLLFGLAVINSDIVYASGEGGRLIKTANGGANWQILNSGITGRITSLSFINALTGTGCSHGNRIIRTTNGGINWVQQPPGVSGQDFNSVYFINSATGYIAGSNGTILYTNTSGYPIPQAPNLLQPANGANNVSLTTALLWDTVQYANTYQVQISQDTGFSSSVLDSANIVLNTINVPSGTLQNNEIYYWRVRASNPGATGNWSSRFSFRTIVALPNAPNLLLPPNGASNVPLNPLFDWDSTSPADYYRLQATVDSTFSSVQIDITGITQSMLQLTNPQLQNNFRYYWRVNATNAAGTGIWSSVFNFTTVFGIPAPPTLLSPPNGATGVSLTPLLDWADDISVTSYRLQIAQDSLFNSILKDTTGFTVSQVQIQSGLLENFRWYYWRVRTTNSIGTGDWSLVFRFRTVLGIPAAPQLVSPANNATEISTTPLLDWDSVQFAETFRVQLSADSTFSVMLINAGGLVYSQYNVPGGLLSNNTVYYWRVNASNSAGTGPFSAVWRFRTVVSPPVAAPILISPPNGANNQTLTPLLDWNDVFGAAGYRVIVSTDSLFNTQLIDTTLNQSEFTVPPGRLTGSTTYYWRVRAFNSGGFGPWSVTWRFSTMLIGIEPSGSIIPDRFMLYSNYPNPFNPVTKIKFDIPAKYSNYLVNLTVYDINGRTVKEILNSQLAAGRYTAEFNAEMLSSGIYFYRLSAGNENLVRKMAVIK